MHSVAVLAVYVAVQFKESYLLKYETHTVSIPYLCTKNVTINVAET